MARAVMTLAASAAAGFVLWYVPHFNRWTTGGYWGVIALMSAAGLLLGASRFHAHDRSRFGFLVAFLPVLVAAGWVILASQPQANWVRDYVLSWSSDMTIGDVVHNLGEHVAVVAFGLGVVFGHTFELGMLRRRPTNMELRPATVAVTPGSAAPPAAAGGAEPEPVSVEPMSSRHSTNPRDHAEPPVKDGEVKSAPEV